MAGVEQAFRGLNLSLNPFVPGVGQLAPPRYGPQQEQHLDEAIDRRQQGVFTRPLGLINPMEVTVSRWSEGAILVTCAEMDEDGVLSLKDACGENVPKTVLRQSTEALTMEEVERGENPVCIRGELGVVACKATLLPGRKVDRHQDRYEAEVLKRTSDGQIVKSGLVMTRRTVYKFPGSFWVRPLNPIETVPTPGEAAHFAYDMNSPAIRRMYPFNLLFPIEAQEPINQPEAIPGFLLPASEICTELPSPL